MYNIRFDPFRSSCSFSGGFQAFGYFPVPRLVLDPTSFTCSLLFTHSVSSPPATNLVKPSPTSFSETFLQVAGS